MWTCLHKRKDGPAERDPLRVRGQEAADVLLEGRWIQKQSGPYHLTGIIASLFDFLVMVATVILFLIRTVGSSERLFAYMF